MASFSYVKYRESWKGYNPWADFLDLCILMDFPIQIATIRMGSYIISFKGSQVDISKYVIRSLNIVFITANSAGPDEIQHYAAFHLVLHYLSNYLFRGFQYTNG